MSTHKIQNDKKCQNCLECSQEQCFINKYCSEEWLPVLNVNKSIINYPKGSAIFSEGQAVKGTYVVYSGKVKEVSSLNNNKERIVRLVKEGEIIGHRGYGHSQVYPVSAYALTNTVITYIPNEIFSKILRANAEFCYQFMLFISEELKRSEEEIKMQSFLNVKTRVAHALFRNLEAYGYADKSSGKLEYTLSRRDIANMAGTTYETVIRVLHELSKLSIIKLVGKSIHIVNEKALKALIFNGIELIASLFLLMNP